MGKVSDADCSGVDNRGVLQQDAAHRSIMKILLIDNNDSFTANLEHLLAVQLGSAPIVVPFAELPDGPPRNFDLIVLSPGPGAPKDYPGYARVLDCGLPVLGVCLGMQIINEHFGGTTARLAGCVHGKTETIQFAGQDRVVARYHSLYCEQVGQGLEVLARNRDEAPMVMRHRQRPILGYQFHPESFLTQDGGFYVDYAVEMFGKT